MTIEIGSSEAPVVMGCSRFSTPWRLWAEKTGLLKPEEVEGEQLTWGTRLEKSVLDGWIEDTFRTTCGPSVYYVSESPDTLRRNGFMRATPDALLHYRDLPISVGVEVKCCVNDPPPVPRVEWLVQVLHQRLVFPEVARWFIVAFGSLRCVSWEIPKHEKAEQTVLAAELMFVDMCEKGTPPPVSAMDASYLHKAWPYTSDAPVALDHSFVTLDEQYEVSSGEEKYNRQKKEEAAAKIQAAMGEHTGAMLPNGVSYTWRPYERDGKTYRRFLRRGGDE